MINAAGTRKIKCLVWDLDETVWQGRLLDGDTPELRPGVTDVLKGLDNRGVIHSIASTNDHDHAWSVLDQFGISSYFVAPQINMGNKVDSIKKISNSLNFALNDIAFIDDDPMELEMVRSMLPEVVVLPSGLFGDLLEMPEFTPDYQSDESMTRRRMLQEEIKRNEDIGKYSDIDDFFKSCQIKFTGRLACDNDCLRISELASRTNQMNINGLRYSREEIALWSQSCNRYSLVASLSDKYGDYGTVAAAIIDTSSNKVDVNGLWISCRVGKKGLPTAFFTYLGKFANKLGFTELKTLYTPTGVNRLAAFHMGIYGFKSIRSEGDKTIEYNLRLPEGIREFPEWINAECEWC